LDQSSAIVAQRPCGGPFVVWGSAWTPSYFLALKRLERVNIERRILAER